jgi:endonuclease/exonuclease/phosphatase family metal-dependent hydrolase
MTHWTVDSLALATFNIHLGMDGWGRPFDVSAECADLDADVIVMQEVWAPDVGGPTTAEQVAHDLGYAVVADVVLARCERYAPSPKADQRWGPPPWRHSRAFHLDRHRRRLRGAFRRPARASTPGRWSLAMLARIPLDDVTTISLGPLRHDPADRAVVRAKTDLGGRTLTVMGTHMAHLTDFSPLQYRRLAALLPPPDSPAVLAGDMNLWGPPVTSFFPAWRRAVTGRTWPAHRPHSQLDHVLVTASLRVVEARIADRSGSDHRPVVVRLALA